MPQHLDDLLKNIMSHIVQRHAGAAIAEIAAAMATEIEALAQDRVADLRAQVERGDES